MPGLSKQYMRKVGDNKNCIKAQIRRMEQQLDRTHTLLFVHKARANPNISIHR